MIHLCEWITGKILNIWKAQWKHSYITFWFPGNSLVLPTNKYCGFNATLVCSVREEQCNFQCPKLKIHNSTYGNVNFYHCFASDFPKLPGYPSLQFKSLKILCVFNNSSLASYKILRPVASKYFECYSEMAKMCDSMWDILSLCILMSICFILINHIYLKFGTMFFLISVNMKYSNEAILDRITTGKILHLRSAVIPFS